jgi:hypothetical protein
VTAKERARAAVLEGMEDVPYESDHITAAVEKAIDAAVKEEREAAIAVVRKCLQFDSQRAVSWHEVNDAIDAIRKRG